MKWFTPNDIVSAYLAGEMTRYRVRQNRNTARRRGYPEREKCFDDALKLLMNCVRQKQRKNNNRRRRKL